MTEKAKCKNCTNKKEIIEEMAKEICNVCYERQGTGTRWCEVYERKDCSAYDSAEILYNAGYRKLPEGAVVLQQETAKEIFAQIDKNLRECTIVNEGGYGWNYQGYEATDLRKRLTKLAKHYGVEVEE